MEELNCSICNIALDPNDIRTFDTCSWCEPRHIVGRYCCYGEHLEQLMVWCDYCKKERILNYVECKQDNCGAKLHQVCFKPHLRSTHKPSKVDIETINSRLAAVEERTSNVEKHLLTVLDLLGLEPTQEKAKQLKEHFESISQKICSESVP